MTERYTHFRREDFADVLRFKRNWRSEKGLQRTPPRNPCWERLAIQEELPLYGSMNTTTTISVILRHIVPALQAIQRDL